MSTLEKLRAEEKTIIEKRQWDLLPGIRVRIWEYYEERTDARWQKEYIQRIEKKISRG